MKALIKLNFAAGLLFVASDVGFVRTGSSLLLLANFALLIGFCVLGVANLVAIFTLWKHHNARALIPLGSFVVAAMIGWFGGLYGGDIALRGTPARPSSFFIGDTREEFTLIANQLIGNGFKEIVIFPDKPTSVSMIAHRQQKDVAPKILATLRKYGFQRAYIDDVQGIAEFSYNHLRTWHDYTWAKNGLSESYSMSAMITEVDIESWGELRHIAKEGTPEKGREDCGPSMAYLYLKDAIGEETLNRIKEYRSGYDVSDEEQNLVLSALNKQVLMSSALVEHPQVTYEETSKLYRPEMTLNISGCSIGDGFWVVTLLKRLLSEGVITLAPDGRHLKIKAGLTDMERNRVEWLHVGIMNFTYSNFLHKRPHPFTKDLGGGWYFNQ